MRSAASSIPPLLVLLVLLGGCSAGSEQAAGGSRPNGSTTSAAVSGSQSAGSAPTGGSPDRPGCAASGKGVPAGADSAPTLDVDGDGRPDKEWIARSPAADGSVAFGVTTASGGTFSGTIESASPVRRSVLVADVSGHGKLIALASDGRQVLLYAISRCTIIPIENAQGEQYAFDLGFTGYGTGVGCLDVDGDGTRDLAGLLADGATVTRTAVELKGPRATNGPSSTVSNVSSAQAELARQVTCGDLTLAEDGVSSNP